MVSAIALIKDDDDDDDKPPLKSKQGKERIETIQDEHPIIPSNVLIYTIPQPPWIYNTYRNHPKQTILQEQEHKPFVSEKEDESRSTKREYPPHSYSKDIAHSLHPLNYHHRCYHYHYYHYYQSTMALLMMTLPMALILDEHADGSQQAWQRHNSI